MNFLDSLLARDLFPDAAIRWGIRRLLNRRLRDESRGGVEKRRQRLMKFVENARQGPVAVQTQAANAQHYEVPARFFQIALGRRLKYSSGLWNGATHSLDQAEEAMLQLYIERARIQDGQSILDLGCGWGSLSLYLAERYPNCRVTGVSNSRLQKEFIDAEVSRRSLKNLTILTDDINRFEAGATFDRILSVEMFEHTRNLEALLEKVSRWMKDDGLLFVHIFVHRESSYLFEDQGESDWMSRHFFTGGMMPSADLLHYFQKHVRLVDQWHVSGRHYAKTAQAWLANIDAARAEVQALFARTYGSDKAQRWLVYWRVFFMSCAELWGYAGGGEWFVAHYLFQKNLPVTIQKQ